MMIFGGFFFFPYYMIFIGGRRFVLNVEVAFADTIERVYGLSNGGDVRVCTTWLINFVKDLTGFSGIKAVSGVARGKNEVHYRVRTGKCGCTL
jgi:hypothetical protein